MKANVLDLRKKMSEVMPAIGRHEHVTLPHRGHRHAMIVPLTEKKKRKVKVADLPAFGMWAKRDEMTDAVTYVEKLREPRGN